MRWRSVRLRFQPEPTNVGRQNSLESRSPHPPCGYLDQKISIPTQGVKYIIPINYYAVLDIIEVLTKCRANISGAVKSALLPREMKQLDCDGFGNRKAR
jgi:hypothetical protein